MGRGVFSDRPEHIFIEECPDRELRENEIRIKSEFSAIKHGTDFNILSGKSPFATMSFDSNLRMFIDKPLEQINEVCKTPFGNMTVGTVLEVGKSITNYKEGEKVYAYGPIAEHAIVSEFYTQKLPDTMNEMDAVCTDPALYAYSAVRDSNAKAGDNVTVSGLGAIGMFVVQLLALTGCMEIIVVDPILKRRELALKFGATLALDPKDCDVGLEIHKYLGKGADIAIEASGSYKALRNAMRSVQMCGTIVTLGYYKGTDQDLALGWEWHHNRLTMISSMPTWNNPLRDYPLWNEDRLKSTLREMFSRKMLTSKEIIYPIVNFDDCVDSVMDVYRNPEQSIKLGVKYGK